MKWAGPLEGGVTQSLISKFLECPYRFYLYAGLGLQEPEQPEPNLVWGDICHKGLEHIIEIPYQINEFTPEDWTGIHEHIDQYVAKYWPTAPSAYIVSIKNMIKLYDDSYKSDYGQFITEQKFARPHTTASGNEITLRGKADGVQLYTDGEFGDVLVEHKCKGKIDKNQTFAETPSDLQVTVYCKVFGTRTIIYDLIKIPDTQWTLPPRGQYYHAEKYIKQLYDSKEWGDFPINRKKHLWLQQMQLQVTEEQIEETMAFTVDPLIDRLCAYWDHVSDPNFDYQNPKYYNELFYRTPIRHFDPGRTQSYKCSYWNHLTGALDIEDMIPVTSFYAELDNV